MFRIYTVSKITRQRTEVIITGLTEKEADSICSAWGWNYCNEEGISFWIDYEEEE